MTANSNAITITWTGNDGTGTADGSFSRESEIAADGRPTIPASPPANFAGAEGGWSPEDLLAAAVSQCHMLWFLHLCARNGVIVQSYVDNATATLETQGSKGSITAVALRATVGISAGEAELTHSLFEKAGDLCYIAKSLNCPVTHHLDVVIDPGAART